eukprot:TRINITY_DN4237_c0_g4_i1.p1 TRINITY_DN4237_c0_g4~~TRINITY_DN4237_c0_g4_i1.p1  ORF type:complete len:211 (-),score=31.42 TRINITY_DN4237_c0_g4_i1:651-1283(-)
MAALRIPALLQLLMVTALSLSKAAGQSCPTATPNPCFNAPGTASICCPGSCGVSTGPNGVTATCAGQATPTLSNKALFNFTEAATNCEGQAAAPGQGNKFGDWCTYIAPLVDESDNVIGNTTYLISNYRTSTPSGNYYELNTETFFFGPDDSGKTDTISIYGVLLAEETELIILGGTGKYRGAKGYVLTRPSECNEAGDLCYFPKDFFLV